MISVFDYTDFRAFIQAAISDRKSTDSVFTHRYICAQLGLRTSNFILLVGQGKRNLTAELAQKLANLLGLKESEIEYFLWMTLFGQASTVLEKENFWQHMLSCRSRSKTARIQESQYEYYKHWYNPVIRELVAIPNIKWDARQISKALKPKVPVVQVRNSLELLEKLGFIQRDGESWVKSSPFVATAPEVQSVAVFNYHRELISLAKESLERDSGHIRNFTSVTLEMNAEEYKMVVDLLTKFRRETLGICGSTGVSDRVYQLNLQLFPVSQNMENLASIQDEEEGA
jgi:uncharacterized protein (TIGR02147 family)